MPSYKYFYTLFDESGSRNKHDQGAKSMFLDEAIPTRSEILKNKVD